MTQWEKIRDAVLHRDGKCMNCGAVIGLAVHHITSRGAGGTDDVANLISLCLFCHNAAQDGWIVIGKRVARSKANKFRLKEGEELKEYLRGLIRAPGEESWGGRDV